MGYGVDDPEWIIDPLPNPDIELCRMMAKCITTCMACWCDRPVIPHSVIRSPAARAPAGLENQTISVTDIHAGNHICGWERPARAERRWALPATGGPRPTRCEAGAGKNHTASGRGTCPAGGRRTPPQRRFAREYLFDKRPPGLLRIVAAGPQAGE